MLSAAPSQRILAVIPCLNEEAHIRQLVDGLVANNSDLSLRIVIADGGSSDKTPAIARELANQYSTVVYLYNTKRIQSAAVNLAVATEGSGSDCLIRIDAHASYPADFCRVLLAEQQATGAASVVVPMNTVGQGDFQRAVAAAQNSKLGNGGSSHRNAGTEGKWVDHGHHALMRIDAFTSVGGYDETFSHNEDAELDHRLALAGHKIWLTGKTALDYYPRSTPGALFQQYMRFGHGRARTILKHKIVPKPRQMAPAFVLPALVLSLLAPILPIAFWPFAAWVMLCLGYGVLLGVKAKDNAVMMYSGLAAMIMHMGWSIGFWRGVIYALRERRA